MSVTIALSRLPLGDPHDCTDAHDELTLYQAFYDTLVRREGTGFVPHLAESWTVDAHARRWSFRLRDGVRFHDDTPLDAEAVARSLRRMAREDKGYTLGSPAVWRQYLGNADISADGLDLTVALAAPMADFLDILVQGFIVAPSALERLDADDTHAICGSGAYIPTEIGTTHVTACRNPHWFGGNVANEHLCFVREANADARLAMLADGRVQFANALKPTLSKTDTPAGATLHRIVAPVAIIYLLNAARGPLADPSVRRALTLAIDREDLINQVLGGAADPLHGFVSPMHFGAGTDPAAAPDPAAASVLLDKAGYGRGLTLTLDCPTRLPDEAEALTAALGDQLAGIGVTLDVTTHPDREAYAHMVRRKEIGDLCVFDSSPMSTFRVLYEKIDSRVAGAWWQGYRNQDVENLIDKGRSESDTHRRAAHYRSAYRHLQSDPPWLTLYNPHRVIGLSGSHPDFRMPVDGVIDVSSLPCLDPGARADHV